MWKEIKRSEKVNAYHEAGHAIACLFFGDSFNYVSIEKPQPKVADPRHANKEQEYVTMMAGPESERKIGSPDPFFGGDQYVLIERLEKEMTEDEAKELRDNYGQQAFQIFTDQSGSDTVWWKKTELLSHELIERKRMSFQEVSDLVN